MVTDSSNEVDISASETVHQERRRPGRHPEVSPELVGLLRQAGDPDTPLVLEAEEPGPLPGGRGIVLASLFSVVAWTVIALVAWIVIHDRH